MLLLAFCVAETSKRHATKRSYPVAVDLD